MNEKRLTVILADDPQAVAASGKLPPGTVLFPETGLNGTQLSAYVKQLVADPKPILTASICLARLIYLDGAPCTWMNYTAAGVAVSNSIDDIGALEVVDRELLISEEYLNHETALGSDSSMPGTACDFVDFDAVKAVLRGAGVEVSSCALPWTYHHDAVRSAECASKVYDRASIAKCFDQAQKSGKYTPEQADELLLCGALVYLFKSNPVQMLSAISKSEAVRFMCVRAGRQDWLSHVQYLLSNVEK